MEGCAPRASSQPSDIEVCPANHWPGNALVPGNSVFSVVSISRHWLETSLLFDGF